MKKIISILVSVIMILTALPVFADGETTVIPASVDIYEALDNFSADELATTYTSSAPYTTASGFKAPTSSAYNTTLVEDNERAYVHMQVGSKQAPNGGAIIYDENMLVKSDSSMEYSVTFRYSGASTELYWYFIDPTGARVAVNESYPLRIWGNAGEYALYSYALRTYPANRTVNLLNDVWYSVSISMDFANKKVSGVVNGGAYDNLKWSGNMSSAFSTTFNGIVESYGGISGIGLGYLTTVNEGVTLDIANIGMSTNVSQSYNELLDFDSPTFAAAISNPTNWTLNSWSVPSSEFTNKAGYLTVENVGGVHGNAVKYDYNGAWFSLTNSLPAGVADSGEDVIIIESSYKSHSNGQPRLYINGTNTKGYTNYYLIQHPGTSGGSANLFGSSGLTGTTPIDGQWHRLRFILDMKNDTITYNRWAEATPETVEVVEDNTSQLAAFSDISNIVFYPYQKTWGQVRYMYLDDYKVYAKDTLRYIGSNPANGEGFSVSEAVNPSILFNMPISSSTATTENVYLLDSDGNKVSGTVGLNYQRNGVAFYPAEDLEADAAYTFVANCEVTDEFGSSLAVNKTIKFETSPTLNLVDFKFMQNDVEAEAVAAGDLVAEIQLKSRANELRNIYAAIAIYNKVTNELVSIDTDSINAVTKTFELTANVPDDGNAYYAKAFVWNTDTTAAPYFAAETLGFND